MKIAVLLSGGVDSSVALWQLKKHGFTDITAYYLKIWLEDDVSYLGNCPWEEDLEYARAVTDAAKVPLEIVPLQNEYYEKVVSYAIEELKKGRTPSPDIFCNQRIKFGAFYDHVDQSYDKLVSGHYSQVLGLDQWGNELKNGSLPTVWKGAWKGQLKAAETGSNHPVRLLRGVDPVKDQSYFLSHLSQEQLQKVWFPIGHMPKSEVREEARALNLANMDRKDSQGICFLGNIKYNDFVKHYLGEKPGNIVELETGIILGPHKGFWFHTIGQRTGLGLGNGPWYVVKKDHNENIVYVSHKENIREESHKELEVGELTWLSGVQPDLDQLTDIKIKLRHGPELTSANLSWVSGFGPDTLDPYDRNHESGFNPDLKLHVRMEEGDKGIAAGQFAVFYQGMECLGSGKIQ